MSFKIEVISNALVITNTVNSEIVLDTPLKVVYYDPTRLREDKAVIMDLESDDNKIVFNKDLADCVDSTLTVFTKETFESFCRNNLDVNSSSKSSVSSIGNNSDIPLVNGGIFEGEAELNNYQDVMTTVKSDVDGVLYMEFSPDGINWDTSLSFQYSTTRINPPHILVKGSRYYRARFENNSGGDQTVLRLNTYFGLFNKLTAPINGTLSENYDAIATRPTDYRSEVAMGKRQGRTLWNKFGYNDDVDTGGEEVIASWGGSWTPPLLAETLTIASSSANDVVTTGTGLNTIVITGIDENRDYQVEVVNLNGTTPVVTSTSWLGVNRISPFLCGSSHTNEGIIDVTHTTSSLNMAQMPIGSGEYNTVTQQAIFYVQRNHQFLTSWLHINIVKLAGGGGDPVVTVRGYVFSPIANAIIQVFKAKIDTSIENTVDVGPSEIFPITESSVLYFTAETDKNNTSVDIRFSGIEERIK